MFNHVMIGDKEVEMVANAATPFRFKQIFHEDFLQLTSTQNNDGAAAGIIIQLAYVMAMQAAGKDMKKLNEETFMAWLEEFEPNAMVEALGDVMDVYSGTAKTAASPK